MRAGPRVVLLLLLLLSLHPLTGCGGAGGHAAHVTCVKAFSARWRAPDGPVAHPPACEAQWAATLDQFTGAVPADDALVWLETVYGRAAPRGPACADLVAAAGE